MPRIDPPKGVCPACLTGYSPTCWICRERSYRMTPLLILGRFPWPNHRPVWDNPLQDGMHCEACGIRIAPEMTMRELTGPCAARQIAEVRS